MVGRVHCMDGREDLPPKREWVLMCCMTPIQHDLYKALLRYVTVVYCFPS